MEILTDINNEFLNRIKDKINNEILTEIKELLNNHKKLNKEAIKKIVKRGRKISNENKNS